MLLILLIDSLQLVILPPLTSVAAIDALDPVTARAYYLGYYPDVAAPLTGEDTDTLYKKAIRRAIGRPIN